MNIGLLIKEKRIEKNMTMKQLADIMKVSEGTVSRWESGDIENIRRQKIKKLSEVLDISIYTLMGWEPSEKVNDETLKRLLRYYNALSDLKKKSLIDYAEYISQKKED